VPPSTAVSWVASYRGRSDYGLPEYECRYCHASFWLCECIKGQSNLKAGNIVYNKCCKGGKVVIPPFKKRPEPLASLARFDDDARSKRFLKIYANTIVCFLYLHGRKHR
jgi:hypothetical protein